MEFYEDAAPTPPPPRTGAELIAQFGFATVRDYGLSDTQLVDFEGRYAGPAERADAALDTRHNALQGYREWLAGDREFDGERSERDIRRRDGQAARDIRVYEEQIRDAQRTLQRAQRTYEGQLAPYIDRNRLVNEVYGRLTQDANQSTAQVAMMVAPGRRSESPSGGNDNQALRAISGNARRHRRR
jgi:hypothetical protein